MKNRKIMRIITLALTVVFTIAAISCFGQTLNSVEDLEKYLNSQPDNDPNKPIKVSMAINDSMIKGIARIIKSSKKYISLNITGNALTTIPEEAFLGCEMLVDITIPNSVTSIGSLAFGDCTSLTKVTIPNSVKSIEMGTFASCYSLTSITIPKSVTSIGDTAFFRTGLISVTIPDSVTSIDGFAFYIQDLTSVTFQGTITADKLGLKRVDGTFTSPFGHSDLREKYLAGGPGTYKRFAGGETWTKQ
jgi:hypothetical protein